MMTTRTKRRTRCNKDDLNLRNPETAPAMLSECGENRAEHAGASSGGIEVSVVQGGERRGWLRSNDRTMIVVLTFPHLSADEKRRWLGALRGRETDPAEIELGLKYDDCSSVLSKKRGQYPERVRLVKYESSIKNDSDVVLLWGNTLTLVLRDGVISLKQQSGISKLNAFYKIEEERGSICIKFKLTTNITSKSHQNRRFRFTARAARGVSVDSPERPLLMGESYDFELIAKHRSGSDHMTSADKPDLSGDRAAPIERHDRERHDRPEKVARVERSSAAQAESLILLDAHTDNEVITCQGVDALITSDRVVAHLTEPSRDVAPDPNSRTRKRRQAPGRTHILKRSAELCKPGIFVADLPTELSEGMYHIKMVGSTRMGESNTVEVWIDATASRKEMNAPSQSSDEALPADEKEEFEEQGDGCITPPAISDITKMWPERKPYEDEILPDAPVATSELEPSAKLLGADLIPSSSDMMLGYLMQPDISSQGLSRSISELNIAKIVSNSELFDHTEMGLTRTESVENLTRNLWLHNDEGGCDLESLELQVGQQDNYNSDYKSDEDNKCIKSKVEDRTLCRQNSESAWSNFLVSDDMPDH